MPALGLARAARLRRASRPRRRGDRRPSTPSSSGSPRTSGRRPSSPSSSGGRWSACSPRTARARRRPPLASGLPVGPRRSSPARRSSTSSRSPPSGSRGGARAARAGRRGSSPPPLLVVLPWTSATGSCSTPSSPCPRRAPSTSGRGTRASPARRCTRSTGRCTGGSPKYEHARRRAVEAILERQPLWILEKLRDEMPAFWAAHGQPIVHLERGAYGPVARPRALAAVARRAPAVPRSCSSCSWPASRGCRAAARRLLVLAFLAFYVLLHVAAHGYPRYRLPAMPAVFLVAAHGWVALARGRGPRVDRRAPAWPRPRPPSSSRFGRPEPRDLGHAALAAAVVRRAAGVEGGPRAPAGETPRRRGIEALARDPARAPPRDRRAPAVLDRGAAHAGGRRHRDRRPHGAAPGGRDHLLGPALRLAARLVGGPALRRGLGLPHGGAAPARASSSACCWCRSPTRSRGSSTRAAALPGGGARRVPPAVLPAPRRAAAALLPDGPRPLRARPPARRAGGAPPRARRRVAAPRHAAPARALLRPRPVDAPHVGERRRGRRGLGGRVRRGDAGGCSRGAWCPSWPRARRSGRAPSATPRRPASSRSPTATSRPSRTSRRSCPGCTSRSGASSGRTSRWSRTTRSFVLHAPGVGGRAHRPPLRVPARPRRPRRLAGARGAPLPPRRGPRAPGLSPPRPRRRRTRSASSPRSTCPVAALAAWAASPRGTSRRAWVAVLALAALHLGLGAAAPGDLAADATARRRRSCCRTSAGAASARGERGPPRLRLLRPRLPPHLGERRADRGLAALERPLPPLAAAAARRGALRPERGVGADPGVPSAPARPRRVRAHDAAAGGTVAARRGRPGGRLPRLRPALRARGRALAGRGGGGGRRPADLRRARARGPLRAAPARAAAAPGGDARRRPRRPAPAAQRGRAGERGRPLVRDGRLAAAARGAARPALGERAPAGASSTTTSLAVPLGGRAGPRAPGRPRPVGGALAGRRGAAARRARAGRRGTSGWLPASTGRRAAARSSRRRGPTARTGTRACCSPRATGRRRRAPAPARAVRDAPPLSLRRSHPLSRSSGSLALERPAMRRSRRPCGAVEQ